jgi:hypothetical protein
MSELELRKFQLMNDPIPVVMVAILTPAQADLLRGQMYADASYFNPTLDGNGEWAISEWEIVFNENPNFTWINDLPLTEWVRPPEDEWPW